MTDADLAAAAESLANLPREMGVALEPFVQSMAAFTEALNEAINPVIEHIRMNYPNAFDESGNLHDDWLHRVSNQQSPINN